MWWAKEEGKNMQIALKEKLLILALAFAALFAVALVSSTGAYAQEEGGEAEVVEVTEGEGGEGEQMEESTSSYTFTAQSGDSYSKIARKAVQIYGIDNQVDLSEAQIIFIETNLTQDAGSPLLDLGQEVQISSDAISVYVDQASNLSEAELAAWQYYANMADFNTNSVGEVQG